jgi:hypothetical protein
VPVINAWQCLKCISLVSAEPFKQSASLTKIARTTLPYGDQNRQELPKSQGSQAAGRQTNPVKSYSRIYIYIAVGNFPRRRTKNPTLSSPISMSGSDPGSGIAVGPGTPSFVDAFIQLLWE